MQQTVMTIRRDNCKNVLSARNAVSVLNDLSPGGALMKSSTQELLAEQYPPQINQAAPSPSVTEDNFHKNGCQEAHAVRQLTKYQTMKLS